jgi:hypothetical protein
MRMRLPNVKFHLHNVEQEEVVVEQVEAAGPQRHRLDAEKGVAEMPEAAIMLQPDRRQSRNTKLRRFQA